MGSGYTILIPTSGDDDDAYELFNDIISHDTRKGSGRCSILTGLSLKKHAKLLSGSNISVTLQELIQLLQCDTYI